MLFKCMFHSKRFCTSTAGESRLPINLLLFLIIKHQTDVAIQVPEYDLSVEVDQIRQQIGDAETVIGRLESQSRDTDSQITAAKKSSTARLPPPTSTKV